MGERGLEVRVWEVGGLGDGVRGEGSKGGRSQG